MVMELPTFETVCPNRNFQKSVLNPLLLGALAKLDAGGSCITRWVVLPIVYLRVRYREVSNRVTWSISSLLISR
jgi:hypothetical protein